MVGEASNRGVENIGIRLEAFLTLGFQFLIRLGPFLDSRVRGNDPRGVRPDEPKAI